VSRDARTTGRAGPRGPAGGTNLAGQSEPAGHHWTWSTGGQTPARTRWQQGPDWTDPDRIDLDRTGPDRTDPYRTDPDRVGTDRRGRSRRMPRSCQSFPI